MDTEAKVRRQRSALRALSLVNDARAHLGRSPELAALASIADASLVEITSRHSSHRGTYSAILHVRSFLPRYASRQAGFADTQHNAHRIRAARRFTTDAASMSSA